MISNQVRSTYLNWLDIDSGNLMQEKWDEITEDIETVFGRGEEADKAM